MTAGERRSVAIVWDVDPIEESVAPLLLHLLDRGWDAHVLCVRSDLVLAGLEPEIRRLRVHPPPPEARRRAPRARLALGAIRAWLRRPIASWRLWTSPDPHLRYLGRVFLALDPAVVHFTSADAATRLASLVSAFPTRVVATAADELPPACDDALLQLGSRLTADGEPLNVLGVGPLIWEEGYEHALEGIRLLVNRGVACSYRIVGRGAFADAVWFARHQLGLERVVEIVDPADRDALRAHLDWADVLVSTAVVSRPSRIRLDAQAAAVPVVATDLDEAAADTGRRIPKRDPEALADALAELAGNRGLLRRLGDAGRDHALEAIGAEERFRRFEEIYRTRLETGRS